MKRSWLLVLLSAILILGAACGDDGGDGTEAGGDSTETEESEAPDPEESESEEAAAGGLEITAVDFAFDLSTASLPAGETEITFTNDGKEPHQAIMALLSEDAPDLSKLIELPQKKSEKFLEEEINDFAKEIKPGASASATLDLKPGTYGMVCFVSNDKGPHAFQGMFNTFTVE